VSTEFHVHKTNENQEKTQFDIIVMGGGMVGAAAACLLAQQGWQIAVVEQTEPEVYAPEQAMDLRVSAISPASVALLQQAGVWDAILAMRVRAYTELATWEVNGLETHFHAHEAGITELGYIIENRLLQLALWQQLQTLPKLKHLPKWVLSYCYLLLGWNFQLQS
jgi:2-octaprenyl-3-methyl-6-methoxy-1,4-benzoquinol hydroxylase